MKGPDGSPVLMAVGSQAREFDVDEDGVLEILSIDKIPLFCKITDTQEGAAWQYSGCSAPCAEGKNMVY